MNRRTTIAVICVGVLAAVLFANLGAPSVPKVSAKSIPVPQQAVVSPTQMTRNASPREIQSGLGSIVTSVRPAVVSIAVRIPHTMHGMRTGVQLLEPFSNGAEKVGSGVIVDPAGYILTNTSVIGNAETARVTMFRGGQNSFLARRIATDPESNIALIKLPFSGGIPHANLGDSSRVRTGDIVVAIGSPFGLAETVTQGIVSANRRSLQVEGRRYSNVIQTDTSINQGNCGGPLINIEAEVIGINAAIFSADSTFSGIGFAIASNKARDFIARVKRQVGI